MTIIRCRLSKLRNRQASAASRVRPGSHGEIVLHPTRGPLGPLAGIRPPPIGPEVCPAHLDRPSHAGLRQRGWWRLPASWVRYCGRRGAGRPFCCCRDDHCAQGTLPGRPVASTVGRSAVTGQPRSERLGCWFAPDCGRATPGVSWRARPHSRAVLPLVPGRPARRRACPLRRLLA